MRRLRGRWVLLLLLVGAGGGLLWRRALGPVAAQRDAARPTMPRIVPDSVRIKVEVLNASDVRGLARRGTAYLRDLGFDVVSSGNAVERLDSALVLVRSGRMDWGELAARGLGGARVEARPGTSRSLDLTVLLGSAWRPPPQAFHP